MLGCLTSNYAPESLLCIFFLSIPPKFFFVFRRILLDTGDGLQPEYISNLLESLSFNKITIKEIILSHWHHDHVGGTLEILKNAEVTTEMMKSS